MALLNFDATTVAPSKGFDPIPGGWYDAKITGSEVKPTKDGSGMRLNLTFEVIGGEFNGRKVFEGLNIKNKSEKAQQISQENLSAICHAVGVLNLVQSEQLHGHPMKIKVKVKPAVDGYEARNEIAAWENINHKTNGGTPGAASAATTQRPSGFGSGAAAAQRPATAATTGPRPGAAAAPAARPTTAAPARPATAAAGQPRPAAAPQQVRPAAAPVQRPVAAAPAPAPAVLQETGVEQPWEAEGEVDAYPEFDENGNPIVYADAVEGEGEMPWAQD